MLICSACWEWERYLRKQCSYDEARRKADDLIAEWQERVIIAAWQGIEPETPSEVVAHDPSPAVALAMVKRTNQEYCKRGHLRSEWDVYTTAGKICRACKRERDAERDRRNPRQSRYKKEVAA